MTGRPPTAQDVAALLRDHQEVVSATWVRLLQDLPNSRYHTIARDELHSWVSQGIAAAIESLSVGSFEAADAYLVDVCTVRLGLGFDISEVIEGMMLLLEAARPVVNAAYPSSSPDALEAISHVDRVLRVIVGRFGHLYAKAAEAELRASEERFRTLADFTYDWEYWLGADGKFVYITPSCERITGYRASEFLDDPTLLQALIHPDEREAFRAHLSVENRGKGRIAPREYRIITRSGEVRWIEHVCRPVYGSDDRYHGRRASNRDVTDRKRAEAALERQVRESAAAAERGRLARELHDSVTQALYSVTLLSEATRIAMTSGKWDVAIDNQKKLQTTARDAMLDMRMLIFELHPPALQEAGLATALQARLASVEARAGLCTEISVTGERELPLSIAEELFWIAVEALNNIVKHASARRATIALQFDDRFVCLEISDDGTGFDVAQAAASGGMGLRGIEERVHRLEGTLEVKSRLGEGTSLRVRAQA